MSAYLFESSNTKAFYTMAWIAFTISSLGMLAGLYYMEADVATKGYLAMTFLFCITSCFTVAKVVRDKHESQRLINKVETAKTEKLINEYTGPVNA